MTYGHPPGGDGAPDAGLPTIEISSDLSPTIEVLPDGREALIYGDALEGIPQQGQNSYLYGNTCGLASCADVLRQMGVEVTEDDVVRQAVATSRCDTTSDPEAAGGTSPDFQVLLLADFGVPAHEERLESIEDLASVVEQRRGVLAAVNAGVLWDEGDAIENGGADHSVHVLRVARDLEDHQVLGFYVNDSGLGGPARYYSTATIREAWLDQGGLTVTTDVVREAYV